MREKFFDIVVLEDSLLRARGSEIDLDLHDKNCHFYWYKYKLAFESPSQASKLKSLLFETHPLLLRTFIIIAIQILCYSFMNKKPKKSVIVHLLKGKKSDL